MKRYILRAEGGFTLIELLVVIAIIGILAAIAVPQFATYRRRSFDADVKSNIRNASTAIEAYFVEKQTYDSNITDLVNKGYKRSPNVTVEVSGAATTFLITGLAIAGCGSGGSWNIDTNTGLMTGAPCS